MSAALFLPVAIPLAGAIAGLLVPRASRWQRAVGLLAGAAHLAVAATLLHRVWSSGIQVVQAGAWVAPFGITLVADYTSALLVLAVSCVAAAVLVFSLADRELATSPFFYPLVHVLVAGVCGAFLAGDFFNMYVWFEVMLVASFVLLSLGGTPAQLDGAIKYVIMNLISSVLLLSAAGLLYGLTGTLNFAQLALRLPAADPGAVSAIAIICLAAFGIKAAVFPFFVWLAVSYHTVPVAISALFAALLTKVGVYALLRTFTLLFSLEAGFTREILIAIAILTMIFGVIAAAVQNDVRRILAIHIVSQVGYLVLGIALATPLGLGAAIFYTIHIIIVKSTLLLLAGAVHRIGGAYTLGSLSGVYRLHPYTAVLFLICALSLAGLPPFSGFWAKLLIVRAALETGAYIAVAAALLVAVGTLFSMMKIWMRAFWGAPSLSADRERRPGLAMLAPITALTALTIALGLWAEPLVDLADRAARGLLDREAYVASVLIEEE